MQSALRRRIVPVLIVMSVMCVLQVKASGEVQPLDAKTKAKVTEAFHDFITNDQPKLDFLTNNIGVFRNISGRWPTDLNEVRAMLELHHGPLDSASLAVLAHTTLEPSTDDSVLIHYQGATVKLLPPIPSPTNSRSAVSESEKSSTVTGSSKNSSE